MGGGVGVLNVGGKRVGVMLVCGKSFQISANRVGGCCKWCKRFFHRRSRKFFPDRPPPPPSFEQREKIRTIFPVPQWKNGTKCEKIKDKNYFFGVEHRLFRWI